MTAGYNEELWDGMDNSNPPEALANGIYFYKITAEKGESKTAATGQLLIIR